MNAVYLNQENERMERITSIAKRRLLKKYYESLLRKNYETFEEKYV